MLLVMLQPQLTPSDRPLGHPTWSLPGCAGNGG
jgi:hypothetical protein